VTVTAGFTAEREAVAAAARALASGGLGETLTEAVKRAILLESICAIAYHARLLGGPQVLTFTELAEVQRRSENSNP
jgi:hypothetical protein